MLTTTTTQGIVVEVGIKYQGKTYALGLLSDDFFNNAQLERGISALCATLEYSAQRLIHGYKIDEIRSPFIVPRPSILDP